MPVRCRVLKEHFFVHTIWEGAVSFDDGLEHNRTLRADPDFDPAMRQLSDARTARSAVSADEVRTLARLSAFGPLSRRAIVVADRDTYAVTRMYEAHAKDAGEVRIFNSEDEALEWLDLAEADLDLMPRDAAPSDEMVSE